MDRRSEQRRRSLRARARCARRAAALAALGLTNDKIALSARRLGAGAGGARCRCATLCRTRRASICTPALTPASTAQPWRAAPEELRLRLLGAAHRVLWRAGRAAAAGASSRRSSTGWPSRRSKAPRWAAPSSRRHGERRARASASRAARRLPAHHVAARRDSAVWDRRVSRRAPPPRRARVHRSPRARRARPSRSCASNSTMPRGLPARGRRYAAGVLARAPS